MLQNSLMRSPDQHFKDLEAIFHRHTQALEAEIRALQQADETANWPAAWKQTYNWHFTKIFAGMRIFRNWGADAAGWGFLPRRVYPSKGNREGTGDEVI